jgi:hypothetical protein
MITQPEQCARLDERDRLHPGTSAMRLLTNGVHYRQLNDGQWMAEPTSVLGIERKQRPGLLSSLMGRGDSTESAMADLWLQARGAVRVHVFSPGPREPFDVCWDPERGWSVPTN